MKLVAGFDNERGLVTRKIELAIEQENIFKDMNCRNDECKVEFSASLGKHKNRVARKILLKTPGRHCPGYFLQD